MHLRAVEESPTYVAAPERLVAETRTRFRSLALDHLQRAAASGAGALTIDLERTTDIDASGLGILVLLQKRARELGMVTRLRRAPDRVRNLLSLTKLDFLFELAE